MSRIWIRGSCDGQNYCLFHRVSSLSLLVYGEQVNVDVFMTTSSVFFLLISRGIIVILRYSDTDLCFRSLQWTSKWHLSLYYVSKWPLLPNASAYYCFKSCPSTLYKRRFYIFTQMYTLLTSSNNKSNVPTKVNFCYYSLQQNIF